MSRIFKRPMFRKGGNVGEGIMTGIVDREMHAISDEDGVGGRTLSGEERLQKIYDKYPDQSIDPIAQLLIQGGLGAMSTTGGGSTIGNLAKAFKDPTDQLFKNLNSRGKDKRNLALEGAILDIGQEGKEALLEKELNFKRQDLDNIDRDIENISKDQVSKGEYSNLLEARRINTWKYKTIDSPELSGKKIGGILTEKNLKNESKFAQTLLNKNKEGYVFYDRFNDRILEVGRIDGEPALIEIQMGGSVKPVETDIPVLKKEVKKETNPSYMRPPKEDIITPKIKNYMEDVEEQEGLFGTGA